MNKWWLSQGCQFHLISEKWINETHHINTEQKLYDHLNRSRERVSQNVILIGNKNIKLSRKRRDLLNFIKVICKNPTTSNILNDERLNMFLLRSGTRQGLSFPASVHCPGVLTQCNHARNQGHTGEEWSEIVLMQRWHDYEYRKIPRNL